MNFEESDDSDIGILIGIFVLTNFVMHVHPNTFVLVCTCIIHVNSYWLTHAALKDITSIEDS